MKKLIAFALSLCLLLALAACGGTASSTPPPAEASSAGVESVAASSEAASLPDEASPAPSNDEIPALVQEIIDSYEGYFPGAPDFLDETQQKQYQAAYIMTVEMSGLGGFLFVGYGQEPQPDSTGNYYLCDTILTSWDDLMEVVDFIFTLELFDELNYTGTEYPMFKEEDGKLYQSSGARGGHMEYAGEPDEFGLVSQNDEAILFSLIGHYADWETEEPYTESYTIEMVNTGSGWRFSQFAIPF